MTHHLENIAGFTSTIFAAIFGAVALPPVAEIVTNDQVPGWLKGLLGPMGALVGMIIVIKWLTARLDKSEEKRDRRQEQYDEQMVELVKLGVRCSDVIEQNNRLLEKRN